MFCNDVLLVCVGVHIDDLYFFMSDIRVKFCSPFNFLLPQKLTELFLIIATWGHQMSSAVIIG